MSLIIQHHDWHSVVEVTEHTPRQSLSRFWSFVDHRVRGIALFMLRLVGERMPVLDQYFAGLNQRSIFDRNNVEFSVVILWVLWSQNLESFFNSEIWTANQRSIRKLFAMRIAGAVTESPG